MTWKIASGSPRSFPTGTMRSKLSASSRLCSIYSQSRLRSRQKSWRSNICSKRSITAMTCQTRSATLISQKKPRNSWDMRTAHYSRAASHCLSQTRCSRKASVGKTNHSNLKRWVPYRRLKTAAMACRVIRLTVVAAVVVI